MGEKRESEAELSLIWGGRSAAELLVLSLSLLRFSSGLPWPLSLSLSLSQPPTLVFSWRSAIASSSPLTSMVNLRLLRPYSSIRLLSMNTRNRKRRT